MSLRRQAALGVAVAVLVPVGLLFLAAWRDVSRVRDQVLDVRATLAASGDEAGLQTAEGRAEAGRRLGLAEETLAASRRRVLASRPLGVFRSLPLLRTQRAGLLALVEDAAAATTAIRSVVAGVDDAAARSQLRDGRLPLDGLDALMREAERGRAAVAPLARGSGGLWGPLADARDTFDAIVRSSEARLANAAEVLRATLGFLGAGGERRYVLALQNNAEMRDQGAVLAYGVLRFGGGAFALEESGSIGELTLPAPTATPIPPGTEAIFGDLRPTQTWQSTNATADFTFTGRAIRDMFEQATGTPVDGVIAVDVPALARLLRVIGPVTVPGHPEPVTEESAARVLLHDQYEGLPPLVDLTGRRDRLAEVTGTVVERLATAPHDPVQLGRALADAARGGHLKLWSAAPGEEEVFEATGLGGPPGGDAADRTFHVAVQNRTATKLDYYVRTRVTQDVTVDDDGDAVVRTTVTLVNTAPVGARPSYQLGPDGFTQAPGDYVGWVLMWAPAGSEQPDATPESGLLVSQRVVAVSAGQETSVTFPETRIPGAARDGRLDLRLVPQPRLEPPELRVNLSGEGRWRVRGEVEWRGAWDRTLDLSWRVSR